MAIPLALIVNELVTNVIRHVGPPCHVAIRTDLQGGLAIGVSDTGHGPSGEAQRTGMGTRIVQVLTKQLGARVETKLGEQGYSVEMTIPVPAKQ
jgi:two-component sensor histidine kinase